MDAFVVACGVRSRADRSELVGACSLAGQGKEARLQDIAEVGIAGRALELGAFETVAGFGDSPR